jgi:hypothetical protein
MLLKFGIFLLPRAKSFLNTLIIKKASPSKWSQLSWKLCFLWIFDK